MQKAILGKKLGMTQIFNQDGQVVPVTVIEAGPCVVVQKKNQETDNYNAVQLGFYDIAEKKVNKPMQGHFKKANVAAKRYLAEFKFDDTESYEVGQEIKADVFSVGEVVDVTGTSKGKGFAGSIKRHNQSRGPMAHGSRHHRAPGSLGATGPQRVFKGHNLPGRMGGEKVTTQNLKVIKVDAERNLLLIKGAIPGAKGSLVTIKDSVKA